MMTVLCQSRGMMREQGVGNNHTLLKQEDNGRAGGW